MMGSCFLGFRVWAIGGLGLCRAVALGDFDKRLHLVSLANDILLKRLGG